MTHSKSHGDREPLLSGELWNEKPLQLHWAHDLTEPRPKASSLYWETNCEKHWSDEQTSRCDSGHQSQMSPSCNDIQSSTHSSRTAQKKIHDFVKSWDFSQTPEKQAGPQSFLMFFYVFTDFILSQFWVSWLWQQSVCSDLSYVFPSVQAVINGCVLIVFTHRGQTQPHPALQHKHCIPPNLLLAHRPETRTSTEVWGGFRPGGQRWCCVCCRHPRWQSSRSAWHHTDRKQTAAGTHCSICSLNRNHWLTEGFPHYTPRSWLISSRDQMSCQKSNCK